MKYIITLIVFGFSIAGFTQDKKEDCGQLPYAKVDDKAEIKTDLTELIKSDLPKSLKDKGSHQAIFKLMVDCNGELAKHMYQRGDISDEDQQWMSKLIGKSKWKAAKVQDKAVTSTVFITVNITNSDVDVIIQ